MKKNLLVLLFGILFSLLIIEGFLWFLNVPAESECYYSSEKGVFKLKPFFEDEFFFPETGEYSVKVNSQGFRDREFFKEKGVFVLGDSFVMGYFLEKQKRFSDIIELRSGVRVFNLGVPASSTVHQEQYLLEFFEELEPEQVFLFFYMDDFGLNLDKNFEYYSVLDDCLVRNYEQTVYRGLKDWLGQNSRIYRLFAVQLARAEFKVFLEDFGIAEKRIETGVFKQETREVLERMRDYLKGRAGFKVFYIPSKQGFPEFRNALFELCGELELYCVDLGLGLDAGSFFETDGHLNERGNVQVAEMVLKEIE